MPHWTKSAILRTVQRFRPLFIAILLGATGLAPRAVPAASPPPAVVTSSPWYTVWETETDAPIVESQDAALPTGVVPLDSPLADRDLAGAPEPTWPGPVVSETDSPLDVDAWDERCNAACAALESSDPTGRSMLDWWFRDLSLFGGVHGFKGPFDRGRNGNFGFNEGVNLGAPLGFWDWGWQLGATAVHSNLSGDQAFAPRSANRNQYFFTGGIFRRVRDWGLQWGVAYDWLHDDYYAKADLKQIRSESSFVFPGGKREIGYFGAYGTGGTDFVVISREAKYLIFMEPTDIFAFYYRRYFTGGGDGRLWLGFSGHGDGLIGGELRAPIGKSWALENRVNYLIPKHGRDADGTVQESWGVTIQLVWYPGQSARCVRRHPYRPMLNVADNTLFMTDTFVPPPQPL